ncbi:DUF3035 domain-containing protein [Pseudoroseicyclus sp. CXY001]|uniref:DUF3035 domain-containing protein n=1 Tax=Pseudoroseicyclus sp. CXY001 TaxID=3242492 RepID=UPI0035713F99
MRLTGRAIVIVGLLTALSACGGRTLHQLDHGLAGPDEFSVLPTAPLVIPRVATLPPPTPGGQNRADPQPNAAAIAALGGNAGAAVAGGVPATDAALVAAAGGRDPSIRRTLAEEDAAFRSGAVAASNSGAGRYFNAYRRQALDAYAELERFRAAGARVPSAPPAGG